MKVRKVGHTTLMTVDEAGRKVLESLEGDFEIEIVSQNRRTKRQKGAMWVYFREMSKNLNLAGYDMKKTLTGS